MRRALPAILLLALLPAPARADTLEANGLRLVKLGDFAAAVHVTATPGRRRPRVRGRAGLRNDGRHPRGPGWRDPVRSLPLLDRRRASGRRAGPALDGVRPRLRDERAVLRLLQRRGGLHRHELRRSRRRVPAGGCRSRRCLEPSEGLLPPPPRRPEPQRRPAAVRPRRAALRGAGRRGHRGRPRMRRPARRQPARQGPAHRPGDLVRPAGGGERAAQPLPLLLRPADRRLRRRRRRQQCEGGDRLRPRRRARGSQLRLERLRGQQLLLDELCRAAAPQLRGAVHHLRQSGLGPGRRHGRVRGARPVGGAAARALCLCGLLRRRHPQRGPRPGNADWRRPDGPPGGQAGLVRRGLPVSHLRRLAGRARLPPRGRAAHRGTRLSGRLGPGSGAPVPRPGTRSRIAGPARRDGQPAALPRVVGGDAAGRPDSHAGGHGLSLHAVRGRGGLAALLPRHGRPAVGTRCVAPTRRLRGARRCTVIRCGARSCAAACRPAGGRSGSPGGWGCAPCRSAGTARSCGRATQRATSRPVASSSCESSSASRRPSRTRTRASATPRGRGRG